VKAFHQIPDIKKTTMTTPFELFKITKKLFRLCNAAQMFQHFIHEVTPKIDFVLACLDDLLVFSPDPPFHRIHLKILFKKLAQYAINIHPHKCTLGVKDLKFLGQRLNGSGLLPLQVKDSFA